MGKKNWLAADLETDVADGLVVGLLGWLVRRTGRNACSVGWLADRRLNVG